MKKFYMTMAAMLCGVAAMAQTNELYADDIKANAGEGVDLVLNLKNESNVTAVSFKLHLPEGVTAKAVKQWSFNEERINTVLIQDEKAGGEGAEPADVYSISRRAAGKDYQYEFTPQTAGWRDEVTNDWVSLNLVGNDGALITAPLTVAETVADGVYEIKLYDISIADDQPTAQSVASANELVVSLTVGKGTGINTINADDVNAPVYNVAGQRVSKAQRGVYIQNGKKVAVK